ncbi:MAG: HepT-like ribonuclease domain-containing protein [Candidatus Humimicrobiaceae bacterium]
MKHDSIYLEHIIDETAFIIKEGRELSFEDLIKSEILKRAIIRSLEIIGEAVKNVSKELKDKYPDIEWKKIAGIRDKLIHDYFGVDWNIVWDVINIQIPDLNVKINKILKEIEK